MVIRKEGANIYIESNYLQELCQQMMDGHVSYGYGSKVPLDAEPSQIKKIDCSGFSRWLIYQATDGLVTMVEGSDEQHAWCKKQKLTKQNYFQTAALSDGQLRIAFIPRVYGEGGKVAKAGHVWLVLDGQTIESHGGKGPSRRAWNHSSLTARVGACFVLAQLYSLTIGPVVVTPG